VRFIVKESRREAKKTKRAKKGKKARLLLFLPFLSFLLPPTFAGRPDLNIERGKYE
jgi:hypothetical protein